MRFDVALTRLADVCWSSFEEFHIPRNGFLLHVCLHIYDISFADSLLDINEQAFRLLLYLAPLPK